MVNNKKVYTQKTTPKGTLAWAFLAKPAKKYQKIDEFEYKTDLSLDPSDADVKEFMSYIDKKVEEAFKEAQEDLKEKKKFADAKQVQAQSPYKAQYDEEGNETGYIVFKFKTNAHTKDGKPKAIGLFDAKAQPITSKDLGIGSGTTGKVNFASAPYYNPATKTAGITMTLNAVQIIDLVPYGSSSGNASSFGFGEEDGYEYEAPPFMSENIEEGINGTEDEF